MFQRILVAVDSSDAGKHIFEAALSFAKATHASLMLLHVLSPFDEGYPNPVYPGSDSVYPSLHTEALRQYMGQLERLEKEGIELLQELADQAAEAGITAEFTQNLGDPSRIICDLARTWNADLVVTGRRGRKGLTEFILGSVSNYVIHHAPCSVMVIQGKNEVAIDSNNEKAAVVS
ncbi:MAG: universal stress protein [Scytolyngbya sp. HA4215-MV1]|nr:universal stress protein [Scytolyngbya sp. HA4215-MV1]